MSLSLYFLLHCSTSLRGTQKILLGLNNYFNIASGIPSHTTLSNWRKKIGYACLDQPVELAQDWVIILDESIQLGNSKLLLILGIRDTHWKFGRPLQLKDTQILYLGSHSPCDYLVISGILDSVQQKIGKIKYAIADQGNSIQKALRLCQIPVVLDITHTLANVLKKQYQQDEQFLTLSKQLVSTIHQIKQTSLACLMAPKKRNKCRYMNLYGFSDWGNKMMMLIKETNHKPLCQLSQQECNLISKMGRITDYKGFFEELNQSLIYIKQLFTEVKNKGVNLQTIHHIEALSVQSRYEKTIYIEEQTKQYLKEINELINPQQDSSMNILCCSDVIESTFGWFKNQMGQYHQNGVTSLALAIPALTCSLTEEVILKMMNNTSHQDLARWEEEYISTTLLKKRWQLIPKKKVRKKTKKRA